MFFIAKEKMSKKNFVNGDIKKKKITLISTDGFIQHGLRSISAFLKKNDFDVNIIFFNFETDIKHIYNSMNLLKEIKNIIKDSIFVGISTNMQVNSPLAIWLSERIKDMNIPLIWGGIYPTINPEDCIKYFDILCIGEGEYAALELAQKLIKKQSIENISNLWVKLKSGKIIRNQLKGLITDLDVLPFPDIDTSTHYYLNKKNNAIEKIPQKNPMGIDSEGLFCIHGARGCPFICSYCSNKTLDNLYCGNFRKIRKRSINLIIEELQIAIKKTDTKRIWFSDDVFTIRSDEEIKLFSELYKKYIDLPFTCYVSPTTVSETKIRYLVDSGMMHVEMGVQSGSDYLNKNIYERPQTKKDVLKAVQILNKFRNQMVPIYQFILFNEYEREEDIMETIDLIKKIPPPYVMNSFTLSLFKGSELYNKYLKDGYMSSNYEILNYTDANVAFQKSINKISNQKHYLYMLLWFMIESTKYGNKIFKPLKNEWLVNIKKIPTWFCYLSSFIINLINKAVLFRRKRRN